MEQPIGFKKELEGKHLVCKLHKALYGLKQAPRAWFDKLKDSLHQIGFQSSKAVKRILRYLKGSTNEGIMLRRSETLALTGFSDADWANDPDDRRSRTGFCIYLGRNIVTWCSKKQHTVSRSSTEAEYRSLAQVATEVLWLKSLLTELKIQSPHSPTLWCDNLSTVALSANPVLHSRTNHIELDLYFVREKVVSKELIVNHVPAIDQVADVLTKALSAQYFQRLKKKTNSHPTRIRLKSSIFTFQG